MLCTESTGIILLMSTHVSYSMVNVSENSELERVCKQCFCLEESVSLYGTRPDFEVKCSLPENYIKFLEILSIF